MGTLQKIIDNLQNLRQDKVGKLSSRYEEHSSWLSSELALVAKLVQKNGGPAYVPALTVKNVEIAVAMPRIIVANLPAAQSRQPATATVQAHPNIHYTTEVPPASTTVTESIPAAMAPAPSTGSRGTRTAAGQATGMTQSATADSQIQAAGIATITASTAIQQVVSTAAVTASDDSDDRRNKRKSPDQPLNNIKLSPEQKRNSNDFERAAVDAGLPTDLSKMKKEHLLAELKKRGHDNWSMKCLKQDIVDKLKALLLEESQSYSHNQQIPIKKDALGSGASSLQNLEPKNLSFDLPPKSAGSGSGSGSSTLKVEISDPSDNSSDAMNESNTPLSASPRQNGKGSSSVLSEYRQQLSQTAAVTAAAAVSGTSQFASSSSDADEQKKSRAQSEFNRRLSNAQARKSDVHEVTAAVAHAPTEQCETSDDEKEVSVGEEEEEEEELFVEQAVPTQLRHSVVNESNSKGTAGSSSSAAAAVSSSNVLSPKGKVDCQAGLGNSSAFNGFVEAASPQRQPGIGVPSVAHTPPLPSSSQAHGAVAAAGEVSVRASDASASPDTWMEVASPQPCHTHTHLANGISLELSGNSPPPPPQQPAPSVKPLSPVRLPSAPVVAPPPVPVPAPAPAPVVVVQSRTAVQVNSLMNLGNPTVSAAAFSKDAPRSPREAPKMKVGASVLAVATGSVSVAEKVAALQKPKIESTPSLTSLKEKVATVTASAISASAAVDTKASTAVHGSSGSGSAAVTSSAQAVVTSNVSAEPVPVKKGLFSFLANKSDNTQPPNTTVTSTASATSAVAPITSSAAASGSSTALAKAVSQTAPAPVAAAASHGMSPQAPKVAVAVSKEAVSPAPASGEEEYRIDDGDSDGESGSGTDEDDESSKKQNKIPDWARGTQLKEALERQYGMYGQIPMDPDVIFPEVQTCSLEEIFGVTEGRSGKYSHRSSSAKWEQDEITLVETRTYRKQMGLGGL